MDVKGCWRRNRWISSREWGVVVPVTIRCAEVGGDSELEHIVGRDEVQSLAEG